MNITEIDECQKQSFLGRFSGTLTCFNLYLIAADYTQISFYETKTAYAVNCPKTIVYIDSDNRSLHGKKHGNSSLQISIMYSERIKPEKPKKRTKRSPSDSVHGKEYSTTTNDLNP